MKYWEKIKEPITKNETPWFVKFMWGVGFLIGITIAGVIAVLAYLVLGYFFSLLWNFSVAPVVCLIVGMETLPPAPKHFYRHCTLRAAWYYR